MSERVEQLMAEAAELRKLDPARLSLIQEAERIAEADGLSESDLFDIRMALCDAAVFSGQVHVLLVAFTWCCAVYDRRRAEFQDQDWSILWRFKWMLPKLASFPNVARGQIESALEDFLRRTREAGYTDRSYHYMRFILAQRMGEFDEAVHRREQWALFSRDRLSDCLACETNNVVEFSVEAKRWGEALEQAAPIIAGRQTCAEVPHATLGPIAKAAANLGQLENARTWIKRGIRMTAGNLAFLNTTASMVDALAALGDYEAGLRLFEKRLRWAIESRDNRDRLLYFIAGLALLDRALRSEGHFRVKIPEEIRNGAHLPDNDAESVRAWLELEARKLGHAFDQRNGNGYWQGEIEKAVSSV